MNELTDAEPVPNVANGDVYTEVIGQGWLIRVTRAADIFMGLEQEIDTWNQAHEAYAPARVPRVGNPCLELYQSPELSSVPWDQWEVIFNDGIHNLRSALDGMCWQLAHLEGAAPTRPKRVYFPMTDHQDDWNGVARDLNSVPPSILERLRTCQPWARSDSQTPDPLEVVREADNDAKHRAGGFRLGSVPFLQYALRPSKPLPPELAGTEDWPITPWLRLSLTPEPPQGFGEMTPIFVMPVVIFGGLMRPMPDAARWLHDEVCRIIQFVADGEWPKKSASNPQSVEWAEVPLGCTVGRTCPETNLLST